MSATSTGRPLAIVTGAGGGIGSAVVQRLVRDGFDVVAADIDLPRAEAAVTALGADAAHAKAYQLDLRDEPGIARLVDSLPRVDALVSNAGIFDERSFDTLTAQDFHRHFEANLVPVFQLAQYAARRMPSGGRIVNIASRAYLGAVNHAHYVASKAAVVGLTRAMAMELLPKGIFVNAVAPGLVDTAMNKALTPERRAAQLALQPTGRAAQPADIANAVAFLASPHTDYITGQVLLVDGGKSLGGSL